MGTIHIILHKNNYKRIKYSNVLVFKRKEFQDDF